MVGRAPKSKTSPRLMRPTSTPAGATDELDIINSMSDAQSFLDSRIKEDQVARILQLIATVPNRREVRQPGDLEGVYDFWFDGGAIELITGTTRFVFQDGTVAEIDVVPTLSLHIDFPNGHVVKVHQQHGAGRRKH